MNTPINTTSTGESSAQGPGFGHRVEGVITRIHTILGMVQSGDEIVDKLERLMAGCNSTQQAESDEPQDAAPPPSLSELESLVATLETNTELLFNRLDKLV